MSVCTNIVADWKGFRFMYSENEIEKISSTVSIPLNEYNKLVRNNSLFHMILTNRSNEPWKVAELVDMVHKFVFPDASAESGDDPDA